MTSNTITALYPARRLHSNTSTVANNSLSGRRVMASPAQTQTQTGTPPTQEELLQQAYIRQKLTELKEEDKWAWLKNTLKWTAAIFGVLVVAGQIISRTGAPRAGELKKQGKKYIDTLGEGAAGNDVHILFTGANTTWHEGKKQAYELSKKLGVPVELLHNGSERGNTSNALDYIRAGLATINYHLRGFSPFGPGNAKAIESSEQLLKDYAKEGKQIHVYGHSMGGLNFQMGLQKCEPGVLKNLKSCKFYGVPLPGEQLKEFYKEHNVAFEDICHPEDPLGYLKKANNIFTLIPRGLQAVYESLTNGYEAHKFSGMVDFLCA